MTAVLAVGEKVGLFSIWRGHGPACQHCGQEEITWSYQVRTDTQQLLCNCSRCLTETAIPLWKRTPHTVADCAAIHQQHCSGGF